jgi:hypothetical protein
MEADRIPDYSEDEFNDSEDSSGSKRRGPFRRAKHDKKVTRSKVYDESYTYPKKVTRKPIQLKIFAHQMFMNQKESSGFQLKTNEEFVLYLLMNEEKRRDKNANDKATNNTEDEVRILQSVCCN